jgi:transcription termination/antitermination protein NusA
LNEEFLSALYAIEKEKGIKKETLFEAIEAALVSAYKRNFNTAANVRVHLTRETGEIKVYTRLNVVEEAAQPQLEISLEEARAINNAFQIGDIVEKEVTPKNFGRIAAQTAKQVVIQRIREAERELVFDEYIDREEDIITAIVQRVEQKNIIVDLGKTEAVLTATEQMANDDYKQGERIKAFITEVRRTTKGPQIFISRTHPGLLKRLFELEVPEIFDGTVEVKSVAREAGYRSKLAVYSKNKDVDPVGACVGPKGSRVQSIVNELRGEKIDIVKWDENSEIFVANALSPAKVVTVRLHEDQKVAGVIVPDYQLSLAIGKEGQNARLAAKLTGWKIDITSESQAAERSLKRIEERPKVLGDDEDITDPGNTVPGLPDEVIEESEGENEKA